MLSYLFPFVCSTVISFKGLPSLQTYYTEKFRCDDLRKLFKVNLLLFAQNKIFQRINKGSLNKKKTEIVLSFSKVWVTHPPPPTLGSDVTLHLVRVFVKV